LLLLDLMLTGIDGFEVCAKVREVQSVPIMIMSAKSDEESKIICLELGADDYIEKPFTPQFLLAKVKALLRRNYELRTQNRLVCAGPITLDIESREVWLNHQPVELSVKEYDLLKVLIENPNRALEKEWLFNAVWGLESFSEQATLTVHIRWLREKLEVSPKSPQLITTQWGVGYRFNLGASLEQEGL
ncbi:MAG: response regulator transcription factor, partial [Cellulosilyticaceae bacterium]